MIYILFIFHRFDVSCEILDSGECCINEGEWIPKQTEKNCDNCGYSYGQNKEYCNISGCCDYKKWTQKQICRTCEYDGDNYEKLGIGFYAKQAHCNCCHNFDGYTSASICGDDKIRVGDQLEIIESSAEHRKCVVLKIDDCVTVVYDDGEIGYINPKCYRKTGKHFPELIEFIEKMEGE